MRKKRRKIKVAGSKPLEFLNDCFKAVLDFLLHIADIFD